MEARWRPTIAPCRAPNRRRGLGERERPEVCHARIVSRRRFAPWLETPPRAVLDSFVTGSQLSAYSAAVHPFAASAGSGRPWGGRRKIPVALFNDLCLLNLRMKRNRGWR